MNNAIERLNHQLSHLDTVHVLTGKPDKFESVLKVVRNSGSRAQVNQINPDDHGYQEPKLNRAKDTAVHKAVSAEGAEGRSEHIGFIGLDAVYSTLAARNRHDVHHKPEGLSRELLLARLKQRLSWENPDDRVDQIWQLALSSQNGSNVTVDGRIQLEIASFSPDLIETVFINAEEQRLVGRMNTVIPLIETLIDHQMIQQVKLVLGDKRVSSRELARDRGAQEVLKQAILSTNPVELQPLFQHRRVY